MSAKKFSRSQSQLNQREYSHLLIPTLRISPALLCAGFCLFLSSAADSVENVCCKQVLSNGSFDSLHDTQSSRRSVLDSTTVIDERNEKSDSQCGGRSSSLGYTGSQKFVALGMVKEQLTKARLHLAEVLAFAHKQKRTLILPSCGNGAIGSSSFCSLPLCSYFDLERIGEYVEWVTEDLFFSSNQSMGHPLFVLLKRPRDTCDARNISDLVQPFARPFPRGRASGRGSALEEIGFVEKHHVCASCSRRRNDWSGQLADETDLVVFAKQTADPCMRGEHVKLALTHLRYSKVHHEKAREFAEKVLGRRFLSIHWRFEKTLIYSVNKSQIMACMEGLQRTIDIFGAKYNLTGYYLATDLPKKHSASSTSFNGFGRKNINMIKEIVEKLNERVKFPSWEDFDPNFGLVDSGIRGILDKLVCSRSFIFLYPPSLCFGHEDRNYIASSYTKEIIEIRNSPFPRFKDSIAPKRAITKPWNLWPS